MKALHDIMMMMMEMVMTMMGHRISRRKQTVSLVGEGCWCPMVLHACPIAPPSILILFHPPHCDPLHPPPSKVCICITAIFSLFLSLSLNHLPGPGWSKSKEKVIFLRHEGGRWLKENYNIWNLMISLGHHWTLCSCQSNKNKLLLPLMKFISREALKKRFFLFKNIS